MDRSTADSRRVLSNRIAPAIAVALLLALATMPARAEHIAVSATKIVANSAVFIAIDKGYFAAEGLELDLVPVQTPAASAAGVASGAVDFAVTGVSVAMYALAGQGHLRVIAGEAREVPTFHNNAWAVSRRAYETGFRGFDDMPGHSFAVTSFGSPGQYALALMARKIGFDPHSVAIKAMESSANSVSALAGGQVDASVIPGTAIAGEVERGNIKIIGWVGDENPWQVGVVFTSAKLADEKGSLVERFLRAYRKAARDYHDAFTGPGETRQDQAIAPAIVAILTKNLGQTAEQLMQSLPYIDAQAELDEQDVLNQIAWFQSQKMLKDTISNQVIDKRYAILLQQP